MPKVELHVQLTGAIRPDTLALIAEQNEIEAVSKPFRQWLQLMREPDYARLDQIAAAATKWLLYADDITRAVYELGVQLVRQNVRYAEVCVDPTVFAEVVTFEQFLAAINDGRDRAQRAWGVQMAWLLCIPRDNPRSADEIARWATNASARRNGIVGMGLYGAEDAQPVGQFERAFRTADKKGAARAPQAGDALGAEGVRDAIAVLEPDRLVLGWGEWQTPEIVDLLLAQSISVSISPTRTVRLNPEISDYSKLTYIRDLYDAGVVLVVGSGMPALLGTSLTDEYLALHRHLGFSLDEIQDIALNGVRVSQLTPEEKQAMLDDFSAEYERLAAAYAGDEVS
jgi:adenosine deaminase